MNHRRPARSTFRTTTLVLAVAVSALIGFLGYTSWGASPTAADQSTAAVTPARELPAAPPKGHGSRDESGRVSGSVTVFDDSSAAVSKLDGDLLNALRKAAKDAADDGITLYVNSGWRSTSYQNQLLHDAVAKYGSQAEAARWVATPKTSPHVSGDAVDIGKTNAMSWLSQHGAAYGLCQIYGNEPWHFELRDTSHGCPQMYADPTHDPRMQ